MVQIISSRLNRRTLSVLVGTILLLTTLLIGWVIYRDSQKPVAERISGYTWCLFLPYLNWTFNEDGSFQRKITYFDGNGAGTRINKRGTWFVNEELSKEWITIIDAETQTKEQFPIKAVIGGFYLRLEGNFQPLSYKIVNLYRCSSQ